MSTLSALAMQRRLTAIQVLHARIAKLTKARGAAANEWGKKEKEALETRDNLIEESVPGAKACRDRLLELQQAHARLKTIRGDKKRDMDTRAAEIAEVEGFLTEVIAADLSSEQLPLELGDKASVAEGLALTPGAIRAINTAATDVMAAKSEDPEAKADPEVEDLVGAISEMGLENLRFGEAAPAEDASEEQAPRKKGRGKGKAKAAATEPVAEEFVF